MELGTKKRAVKNIASGEMQSSDVDHFRRWTMAFLMVPVSLLPTHVVCFLFFACVIVLVIFVQHTIFSAREYTLVSQ